MSVLYHIHSYSRALVLLSSSVIFSKTSSLLAARFVVIV